jgi:hypothetical protein
LAQQIAEASGQVGDEEIELKLDDIEDFALGFK